MRTWGLQTEPFEHHYHTIIYSLRYHYPNAWIGDGSNYTTTVHMQDLAALIQALRLAPAHVIGSSYGADIVLLLAQKHPELLRTIVLGEPLMQAWLQKLPEEASRVAASSSETWEAISATVRTGDVEGGVRMFADGVFGKGVFDQLPEPTRRRLLDNAQLLTLPESAYLSTLTCEQAQGIQALALLLTGEYSPKQFLLAADALERCMPHLQRAVIPRAAHLLHGMNPQSFNETVLSFLAEH
jgi:non-heme chloroperoxidase